MIRRDMERKTARAVCLYPRICKGGPAAKRWHGLECPLFLSLWGAKPHYDEKAKDEIKREPVIVLGIEDALSRYDSHSASRPAARTRGGHFCISAARKVANSRGDTALVSKPSFLKVATAFGDFKLSFTAVLSLLTISGGVPAGARNPSQASGSKLS